MAPLVQWGHPTYTPGTALDNGGRDGWGGGGCIGRVDAQLTTMQLIMRPIVLLPVKRAKAKFCAALMETTLLQNQS